MCPEFWMFATFYIVTIALLHFVFNKCTCQYSITHFRLLPREQENVFFLSWKLNCRLPHATRMATILQLDWFCYQKLAELNDSLRLSCWRFAVRAGVTGNLAGWISCGIIRSSCQLISISGSYSPGCLWGFQPLSQRNTLKTRLKWERTLQDVLQRLSQGSTATSQMSVMADGIWNIWITQKDEDSFSKRIAWVFQMHKIMLWP